MDPQIHHTSLQVFVKRMASLSYDCLHVVYEVILFLCLPVEVQTSLPPWDVSAFQVFLDQDLSYLLIHELEFYSKEEAVPVLLSIQNMTVLQVWHLGFCTIGYMTWFNCGRRWLKREEGFPLPCEVPYFVPLQCPIMIFMLIPNPSFYSQLFYRQCMLD